MKKLLMLLFIIILISIFNIKYKSNKNYIDLLRNPKESSIISIEVFLKQEDLIELFKDSELGLVSITPNTPLYNKSIRLNSDNIFKSLMYVKDKLFNELKYLGYDEEAINFKTKGFNVSKIKVFGNNLKLYELLEKIGKL